MARGNVARSTSGRRRAWARRSRCSTRAGGAPSAAPTSWSAWSRPTAASSPQAQIGELEVIPRRTVEYRGRDVRRDGPRCDPRAEARAACSSTSSRTPTCPGSRNEKRWQDVEELLDAGINVISTLNIQHLESVNDVVERITGVKQQETIPDEVVRSRRAGRAGRHDTGGAPPADGARQHVPGRARRRVARQLLPGRQPRGAPRDRPAVARRQGRGEPPAVPRGPRHRARHGRRANASSSRSTGAPGGDVLIRRAVPHGAARAGRPARRARARRARARRSAAASCWSSTGGCSPTSAAPTTRSRPTTRPSASCSSLAPERADPARPRMRAGGRGGRRPSADR